MDSSAKRNLKKFSLSRNHSVSLLLSLSTFQATDLIRPSDLSIVSLLLVESELPSSRPKETPLSPPSHLVLLTTQRQHPITMEGYDDLYGDLYVRRVCSLLALACVLN